MYIFLPSIAVFNWLISKDALILFYHLYFIRMLYEINVFFIFVFQMRSILTIAIFSISAIVAVSWKNNIQPARKCMFSPSYSNIFAENGSSLSIKVQIFFDFVTSESNLKYCKLNYFILMVSIMYNRISDEMPLVDISLVVVMVDTLAMVYMETFKRLI